MPRFEVPSAIRQAEVVFLSVPWPAAPEVLKANQSGLAGTLLIDATNSLPPDFSDMEEGYSVSGAERVAKWAPGASVFKAFNQTGAENMANAAEYGTLAGSPRPVMLFCGDDASRRPDVTQLVEVAGFEAVDAGPLKSARLIEPYGMLWIRLAHAQRLGRRFAFSIIRVPEE